MGISPFGYTPRAAVSLLLFVSWPVASACLGASEPATTVQKPQPKGGVHRYLPLEDKTVFSYETSTESGERGLLILEVRRPRAEHAELVVAGRATRLTVNAHDIAHVTGGFLLKEPLTHGATFKGDFGKVTITNVARSVTLPIGAYSGCVETLEEVVTAEGEKRTTTVFCPDVGIALRETEAEQEGLRASERIALKAFGPRY